ncbi:MAG: hypothetical protein CL610_25800 [Anaerolineaceae bacterium]|nr:hypothetical protein [Anaerolineaceae bacterium]
MRKRPLVNAGIFIGLGLGGFFDGIVLHQILQWHHMVTVPYPATTLENLELNTLLDGFFHAATYIFTTIGLILLWRVIHKRDVVLSGRVLFGAALMGWGIFNLVEGLIDHHILQLHHVRSGENELFWDLAFLVWGAVMLVAGGVLARRVPVDEQPNRITQRRSP